MPTELSRYYISPDDLKRAALNVQVGRGIADRMDSTAAMSFLEQAEYWAEEQVEEFIGVPLKPTRAPGQAELPTTLAKNNFPLNFILAVTYRALGLLLNSEYTENSPNVSQSAQFALEEADKEIMAFKERRTFRVGQGRLRHPNPFIPPSIAPRSEHPQ